MVSWLIMPEKKIKCPNCGYEITINWIRNMDDFLDRMEKKERKVGYIYGKN